jgi:beta-lactamase class A
MPKAKIVFYFLLVSSLSGGLVSYFLLRANHSIDNSSSLIQQASAGQSAGENSVSGLPLSETSNTAANPAVANSAVANATGNDSGGHYRFATQNGYNLIKPLLLVRPAVESKEFRPLKNKILAMLEDDRRLGLINSATVYLMTFQQGKWMYINPDDALNPGSLVKVPLLITYLKESETDPQLLNKKITFEKTPGIPTQTYNSLTIQPGHAYTVKDLLHYMIAYSDNNATHLLNQNVNVEHFKRTFSDLNLPVPDVRDRNYAITARRISKFMIVLYNATYLSRTSSEFALKLLSECDFKEGIVKGLPANVNVAHKFGEWGDRAINVVEMHESGIIYFDNSPYLLTVMTKGISANDLSVEISKISRLVYETIAGATDPVAASSAGTPE